MNEKHTLVWKVAAAMREAFAEFTGENVNLVPFHLAGSKQAWLKCADAALRVVREHRRTQS